MKRSHLYAIVNEYASMPDLGSKSTAKFDYFAYRNNEIATQEIKARENVLKPSAEWKAFLERREEIYKKHALKDEGGKPVVETRDNAQFYKLPEEPAAKEAFEADLKALAEADKDAVAARQKIQDDFNASMEEDMTDKETERFHRIKMADVPALGRKSAMAAWGPLIDD